MKKLHWLLVGAALALLTGMVLWFERPVSAHEGRAVGNYEIEFGWQVEPAYAGVFNGPEIFIKQKGATEEDEKPVVGAEKTLKLKVTFGKAAKELKLEPVGEDPGHYLAHLTPTRPGDYTFQLTGVISPTAALTKTTALSGTKGTTATMPLITVNETFSSAAGEFSTVEPAGDVLFPDNKADVVSLQTQVDALKAQLKALQEDVATLKAAKK
ncbi:MAG: hypothetical protein U0350_12130 [Caldilineaceae bacterium]